MPIFGERHLRQAFIVYAAHYNAGRPHRALRLRPRDPGRSQRVRTRSLKPQVT